MTENGRDLFTLGYYEEFVRRLCEGYHFSSFHEAKKVIGQVDEPLVVMRHDIDSDLGAAQRMSSLEKELGIQATYFFMVRCPLYNLFSGDGSEKTRRILADGHHFGLHFDCALYPDIGTNNLSDYISRECALLEGFFGQPVESVSFHRPGDLELGGVELERWPNTYERVFLERFEYFSDSRGNWVRGNPLESEAFAERKNLHILVHPLWWTESPMTPYEHLVSLVQSIKGQSEQYISANCQVWNEAREGRKSG